MNGTATTCIDIVIVNWNSGHLLANCIQSLFETQNIPLLNKIIIVDNGSSDGSMMKLPVHEKVLTISNQTNAGFAKAANQGFKICTADFVLLLNPDTRLYADTLKGSLAFMNKHAEVDVMGCQLLNESGEVQHSCARFPTPLRFVSGTLGLHKLLPSLFKPPLLMEDWDHKVSSYVDQVMGAFMFMKRKVLIGTGYFDERFFVYFEELDFSKRLRDAGGTIYFNASIQAFHLGKGTTNSVKDLRLYLFLESRLKYAKKHFSGLGVIVVHINTWLLEPLSRTILALCKGQLSSIKDIFRAYWLLIKSGVNTKNNT